LLIIELVLREGKAPGFGSADMMMMTLTGGAERTAREFESLLARAGLTMTRVVSTTTSASIVEACAPTNLKILGDQTGTSGH
jgi:type IV pilus biogenesis protein CpaD/CtpE